MHGISYNVIIIEFGNLINWSHHYLSNFEKTTFWTLRFPNVIPNLISLLTLPISPFNNFPPSFDFETTYFIFTMLLW